MSAASPKIYSSKSTPVASPIPALTLGSVKSERLELFSTSRTQTAKTHRTTTTSTTTTMGPSCSGHASLTSRVRNRGEGVGERGGQPPPPPPQRQHQQQQRQQRYSSSPSSPLPNSFLPMEKRAKKENGSLVVLHHEALHRFLDLHWCFRWCISTEVEQEEEEEEAKKKDSADYTAELITSVLAGGGAVALKECPLCRVGRLRSMRSAAPPPPLPPSPPAKEGRPSREAEGKKASPKKKKVGQWPFRASSDASSPEAEEGPLFKELCWSSACQQYARALGADNITHTSFYLIAALPASIASSEEMGPTSTSASASLFGKSNATMTSGMIGSSGAAASKDVVLSFFYIPALNTIRRLSDEDTFRLETQIRASDNQTNGQSTTSDRSSMLRCLRQGAEVKKVFYLFQRARELTAKKRATPVRAALLGDVSACDIFVVLSSRPLTPMAKEETRQEEGEEKEKEKEGCFQSVWGKVRLARHAKRSSRRNSKCRSSLSASPLRPPQQQQPHTDDSATASEISSNKDSAEDDKVEFFFLAHSLEDYFRLGAAFGWVYGWQLCYSARGPPLSSLPWLRAFNASALRAAENIEK